MQYGPMKPLSEQGYSEEQIQELSSSETVANTNEVPFLRDGFSFYKVTDPTGRRVGEACGEDASNIISKVLNEAEAIVTNVQLLNFRSKTHKAKLLNWKKVILQMHLITLRGQLQLFFLEGFRLTIQFKPF